LIRVLGLLACSSSELSIPSSWYAKDENFVAEDSKSWRQRSKWWGLLLKLQFLMKKFISSSNDQTGGSGIKQILTGKAHSCFTIARNWHIILDYTTTFYIY